jgi:uncharacterized small protein (DUF1192 family)
MAKAADRKKFLNTTYVSADQHWEMLTEDEKEQVDETIIKEKAKLKAEGEMRLYGQPFGLDTERVAGKTKAQLIQEGEEKDQKIARLQLEIENLKRELISNNNSSSSGDNKRKKTQQ